MLEREIAGSLRGFVLLLVVVAAPFASPARALPPGRSWSPVESGVGLPLALSRSPDGQPELLVGPDNSAWGLCAWSESTWAAPAIFSGSVGGAQNWNVALTLGDQRHFVWTGNRSNPDGYYPLLMAPFSDDSFGAADTAFFATSQSSEEAGAASSTRRWVMRVEQYPPQPNTDFHVRTFYSDTARIWHELPLLGINEFMGTMAPLGERSAIVVWAGQSGLAWAIADNDAWIRSGSIDPRPWGDLHPRFRFRPSGGLWLMWPDREWVHVSSFDGAEWSRGDSVRCEHGDGIQYASAWCDLSRDGAERPVLVWNDLSYGIIRDGLCVAFPNDSGWDPGEEVPGSYTLTHGSPMPCVTRDDFGDAWVAWWNIGVGGLHFTHTYTHATVTSLAVENDGGHPRLRWSLSEASPGSWWAILSSVAGDPEQVVARVQAGELTAMSWRDDGTVRQTKSYRIRRESVDVRTRWTSDPVAWPTTGVDPRLAAGRLTLRPLGGNPVHGAMRLAVEGGAPGRLVVKIFDLQGREVASAETSIAPDSGPVMVEVAVPGHGPLPTGIYLARGIDAGGISSGLLRLALIR